MLPDLPDGLSAAKSGLKRGVPAVQDPRLLPGFSRLVDEAWYGHWRRVRRSVELLFDQAEAEGAWRAAVELDEALGCVLRALPAYVGKSSDGGWTDVLVEAKASARRHAQLRDERLLAVTRALLEQLGPGADGS